MSVKSELLDIQARNRRGILYVEEVYKWAKDHRKSAIAKLVEWDARKAALQYQLWQIRKLITLHIVSEDGTPEMVSLTIDRAKPGGGYRSISDVLDNKALSAIMLQDAFNDLERIRERYKLVKALTSVWVALDQVKLKAKPRARGKVSTAAP